MKIICLLTGCKWGLPVLTWAGHETLMQQVCTRCGARRTMTCE
jgi:hypothetical protein